MFKRLIIATDLSPASEILVGCLDQLKPFQTKECLLLQCLSAQETASIALSTTASILDRTLLHQKEILESYGFQVETRILPGQIKSEINQIALKEKYTLIVAGSPKQSAASEVFFKGLAHDLALHAKIPLLLVRLEAEQEGLSCSIPISSLEGTSVLFPTDFSKNADFAFEHLLGLASEGINHVTLMHVVEEQESSADHQEKLTALREKLLDQGIPDVKIVIESGNPSDIILKHSSAMKPNLIVMGSQGRGFVREILLGSVSRHVSRHADSSVLLIPAKR